MVATNKKIQKGKITKTKGSVLKIDMETMEERNKYTELDKRVIKWLSQGKSREWPEVVDFIKKEIENSKIKYTKEKEVKDKS